PCFCYPEDALVVTDVVHGFGISGQEACVGRNARCAENTPARIRNRIDEKQAPVFAKRPGRKNDQELEKFALRKDGGRRTVYSPKRSIPTDFHNRHQAKQNHSRSSLESRLGRGEKWPQQIQTGLSTPAFSLKRRWMSADGLSAIWRSSLVFLSR